MSRRLHLVLDVPESMRDEIVIARADMIPVFAGMEVRSAFMDTLAPITWLDRALGMERTTHRVELTPVETLSFSAAFAAKE